MSIVAKGHQQLSMIASIREKMAEQERLLCVLEIDALLMSKGIDPTDIRSFQVAGPPGQLERDTRLFFYNGEAQVLRNFNLFLLRRNAGLEQGASPTA